MSVLKAPSDVVRVDYACDWCGVPIEDGHPFSVVGTMTPEIRVTSFARTDVHVRSLGRLLCGACARRHVAPWGSGEPA